MLIVATSSGRYFNTVRWTRTGRTSPWPATPSTTSSCRIVGSTTFATDPSGCRPNPATSTKTTTSRLVSSDSRGQPPRRVASRARSTTRGNPVYLRPSGVTKDSFDCVVRPTTVLVPSLSTARRASASVRTPSTKTPSWQIGEALAALIGAFACAIRRY